jgi:hypothetical protein
MRKLTLILFLAVVTISVAMAGIPTAPAGTNDILGAHLLYGRGCIGCHAPHSGSGGNGVVKGDTYSGSVALWGQDLTPLYGQTLSFGGGTYSVTLPGVPWTGPGSEGSNPVNSISDPTTVILLCLSCHDGNLAKVGMMKGTTVETLPVAGGHAPTLLGNDGTTPGNYSNDHPVGISATVGCGGQYNWDCGATGSATMTSKTFPSGPGSTAFMTNYGFAVSLYTSGTTYNIVSCTSCHNQHSELIYNGTMTGVAGFYQTQFFLRGYYNPSTGGNNAAQFCRQCHGGESNEMNGQYTVPTT